MGVSYLVCLKSNDTSERRSNEENGERPRRMKTDGKTGELPLFPFYLYLVFISSLSRVSDPDPH